MVEGPPALAIAGVATVTVAQDEVIGSQLFPVWVMTTLK
jgi:hypothetical protein